MKVLLVNNTKAAYSAINQSLKDANMKFIFSEGIENVIEEIKTQQPQIVIINWSADDIDVESMCKNIKKLKLAKYVYIMVIAAREKEHTMTRVISAGADDFIFKPFGKTELSLRATIAKNTIKREEQISKSKKKLIKFSKEDPVTSLLNRRALLDEAIMEMGRASREGKFFSSIMITVNNLKDIMENEGTLMGNAMLLELSNLIKKHSRSYDKTGRYGISQFLIFLPDTHVEQAEKFAGRITDSLKKKPIKIHDNTIPVNLSLGISEFNPKDVYENSDYDDLLINDLLLDSLIRRTEDAVEKASRKGNNSIEIIKA